MDLLYFLINDLWFVFLTAQYKMYTEAEDGMVLLKRMMAEAVTSWNNK